MPRLNNPMYLLSTLVWLWLAATAWCGEQYVWAAVFAGLAAVCLVAAIR